MDFSAMMDDLEDASLFDLYRLQSAISIELENPERIRKIKRLIKVGDTVRYFLSEENRLVEAEVLEIKRTRVLVRNKHDLKRWNIPFYMTNVDDIPVDIRRQDTAAGMDRHEIRIGDRVGFKDRGNHNRRGEVIRLNPKTVTLLVEPNQKWRVSYALLHPIIDGEKARQQLFIEGVVVDRDPD
jgi:hypothetical protein